eukprot:COSAG01_NODE_43723_length_426_cov_28.259939_1_plen_26_part_10
MLIHRLDGIVGCIRSDALYDALQRVS